MPMEIPNCRASCNQTKSEVTMTEKIKTALRTKKKMGMRTGTHLCSCLVRSVSAKIEPNLSEKAASYH